jgi:predicted ribosomally synthesized peptide with nif11-like leader
MSKESAKAYLERLEKDSDFKKKVQSAADDDSRWAVVKNAGFDFTKEELIEVMQEKSGRKLTDAELEQVTGGAVIGAAVAAAGATAGNTVGTIVSNKSRG